MDNLTFKEGSMWENYPWEIRFDCKCSEMGGGKPCEHCHSIHDKKHYRAPWILPSPIDSKTYYYDKEWICPRVMVAMNEGGCNSTGVCLDCIIEAAKTLDK